MLLAVLMKCGAYEDPLTLSQTDSTPGGSGSGLSATGSVTSNVNTVSVVSGGVGPYTYSWAQGPGGPASSGPFNALAPTSAATAFRQTVSNLDADRNEQWTCTVTDTGNDNETATITCLVTLTWTDIS